MQVLVKCSQCGRLKLLTEYERMPVCECKSQNFIFVDMKGGDAIRHKTSSIPVMN